MLIRSLPQSLKKVKSQGGFLQTRFSGKQENSFYGKFNVTLKKESGVWKIPIDADTSEGGTIGAEGFEKAKN